MDGCSENSTEKLPFEKVMLADPPLFERIFSGLHQSPKIMTTGTKEVFLFGISPPNKKNRPFFLFGISPPNKNKNTQPFYALLCFRFFCRNSCPLPPLIHRSDFSSGSPDLCKSNLCLNSEACLSHHCCGSGNDINRTEDLIEVPWIPILGETETSIDMEGTAGNCGENGVWGGG